MKLEPKDGRPYDYVDDPVLYAGRIKRQTRVLSYNERKQLWRAECRELCVAMELDPSRTPSLDSEVPPDFLRVEREGPRPEGQRIKRVPRPTTPAVKVNAPKPVKLTSGDLFARLQADRIGK